MRARWQWICLWVVALWMLSGGCHAQSVTPEGEYKKPIRVDQTLQPLGEHPFGEQIDLSTGALSFEETGVNLLGNGPLLQPSRSLNTTDAPELSSSAAQPFGDWDMGIPSIETAMINQSDVVGLQVGSSPALNRCTDFDRPPAAPGNTINSAYTWGLEQRWYGYHVLVLGEGSQALLSCGTSPLPLQQRVITKDGQNYMWLTVAFDAYAQPTNVKRYNDIAGQPPIEGTTSYLNDTNHWVLGLPEQVTNVGTGEVETLNTYDLSNDTLQSRARFGETLMSYTFNPPGQPASFTDGNSHTTTLGNYYRDIPRTIGYPDNTQQKLTFDDLGQITSITDQVGHTTGYQYDAGVRLAELDYPSGDEVAWYSEKSAFASGAGAECGIGAGHWRRTVTLGNYTDLF